jgi:hypothetical protein
MFRRLTKNEFAYRPLIPSWLNEMLPVSMAKACPSDVEQNPSSKGQVTDSVKCPSDRVFNFEQSKIGRASVL